MSRIGRVVVGVFVVVGGALVGVLAGLALTVIAYVGYGVLSAGTGSDDAPIAVLVIVGMWLVPLSVLAGGLVAGRIWIRRSQ